MTAFTEFSSSSWLSFHPRPLDETSVAGHFLLVVISDTFLPLQGSGFHTRTGVVGENKGVGRDRRVWVIEGKSVVTRGGRVSGGGYMNGHGSRRRGRRVVEGCKVANPGGSKPNIKGRMTKKILERQE